MRKSLSVFLLIAWLRSSVVAGPNAPDSTPHDPNATARASERVQSGPDPSDTPTSTPTKQSPWIDLAPSKVLALRAGPERRDHKLAAALTLGGLYAGFTAWTYFAWYRKGCRPEPKPCDDFIWGKDGAFGSDTYAGGADKLGHAWATLGLARLGTEMLDQWGGYDRRTSTIVGTALSEALFLGVEIRDGFSYQFSYWDFVGNTLGAALAFAQSTWPRVDELVDFRVAYAPSSEFRASFRDGDVDVAEDYSGQTYLLALHLGALPGLRGARWARWAQFVDLAVGFDTRGYKPEPPADVPIEEIDRRQRLFLGVSLNAQGVFDWMLGGGRTRKVLHGVFEVFSLPGTTLPIFEGTRRPEGPVEMDGA